ncbi:uncharacterized protein LOC122371880, partial [Amphibalanus amphitrite]
MSRDLYGEPPAGRAARRAEPVTGAFPPASGGAGRGGSPLVRRSRYSRSTSNSPLPGEPRRVPHSASSSHINSYPDELASPGMDHLDRGGPRANSHHRSRSTSRGASSRGYHGDGHEREFVPIREPPPRDRPDLGMPPRRERSLERGMRDGMRDSMRDSMRDGMRDGLRDGMLDDEGLYGPPPGHHMSRSARQSPSADFGGKHGGTRDSYIVEMQAQNGEFHRELSQLKKELELTNQKLGSSMHSIKTFWSPELKKERQMRKDESAKYSLMNDQIKLLTAENQ